MRRLIWATLLSLLATAAPAHVHRGVAGAGSPPPTTTTDTITITDTSGSTQTNQPYSIARPFAQGEIANFAQASIGGSPLTTQVDVKNRWPDGSLKFAVVSFVVPTITANGTVTVQFNNNPTGNNTGYLSQSQMLGSGYNFDGQIQLTGTASHNISARSMLTSAGSCSDPGSDPDGGAYECSYWLKGPIVTAVIIEDRSGRSFDVNTDAGTGNPLHPIFEAWFYPQTNGVMLGYTLEDVWASTTAANSARDQTYTLKLTAGNTSPVTVLPTTSSQTQRTRTRWHHSYCGNGPGAGTAYVCGPGANINYNWAYLATTKFTPNWDSALVLNPSLISGQVSSFATMPQGFEAVSTGGQDGTGGIGFYTTDFDGTGVNPSHGPLTTWDIITLTTSAPTMFPVTYGNADLGGIIPYFYREADTNAGHGQTFDNSGIAGNIATQGRVVSINARTQVSLLDATWNGPCNNNYTADWINFGGSGQDIAPWGTANLDPSHWPNLAFASYMLTGEYAYYEEQMMQSAYALADDEGSRACIGSTIGSLRQGPAGYWWIDQERGTDWQARENALGAFIAVDGSPESAYFKDKLLANLAVWEGLHGITNDIGSAYATAWTYGNTTRATYASAEGGPLGSWTQGTVSTTIEQGYANNSPICSNVGGVYAQCSSGWPSGYNSITGGNSYFMNGYSGIAVTWINDLGFCPGSCQFLDYIANFYLNEALNPSASIYDFDNYVYPTLDSSGTPVASWSAFESDLIPAADPDGKSNSWTGACTGSNFDEWYPGIIAAVMSELTTRSSSSGGYSGLTAYNNVRTGGINPCLTSLASVSPKWDIVPRVTSSNDPLSAVAGWHKIPSTAMCGGGAESNASYSDPNTFPANLGSYTAYGFSFHDECDELMEDSNSAGYDTARHRMVFFGGGHSGYHGNDVFSLELTQVLPGPAMFHLDHSANPNTCPGTGPASTIVTESDGSVCQFESGGTLGATLGEPACTYVAGCTPTQTTTPGSVHTYDGLLYIPGYDELLVLGGITAPQGNTTENVWLLALSSVLSACAPVGTVQGCNPSWFAIGGAASNNAYNNSFNAAGTAAAYDPNTLGVFAQNESNLQWFNPANNTFASISSNGIGYHSVALVDPVDKYLILIGPQSTSPKEGILYINIACTGPPSSSNCASAGTVNQPTTSGCTNLTGGTNSNPQYMGAVWDPIGNGGKGRVVVYPNAGNVIWYINPTTWTCTTETYGSTQGTDYPQNTPLPGTFADGTYHHFAYDPTFDIFLLCNDPNNDCWYLRPNR